MKSRHLVSLTLDESEFFQVVTLSFDKSELARAFFPIMIKMKNSLDVLALSFLKESIYVVK